MADEKTFAQAVYESAARAASSEAGQVELQGHSRDQFLESIRLLTEAMDKLPTNTSLHVVLFAVTYMRSALLAVMQANQSALMRDTGGNG